jgi:MscS family membrane protein
MSWNEEFLKEHGVWMIELLAGLSLLVAINYAIRKGLRHIRLKSLSSEYNWKVQIEEICSLPLRFILWIFGIVYVLDVLGRHFGFGSLSEGLHPLRNALVVLCLGWLAMQWKSAFQRSVVSTGWGKKAIDTGMIQILGRLLSMSIVVLTVMIALQMLGLNIVPLLAFGGIGAAALGFAGKDVIANFFGGLMLHVTRPFTIGDTIIHPEVEGVVEEIGWYLTSVRDKSRRPVYVPNAVFSTALVINVSRMTHRHIEEKIGIRYEDMPHAKEIVREIREDILSHPATDRDLPVLVFLNAFGPYSLDIYVDCYILETRLDQYLRVKQEILLNIYSTIESHGAQIPVCPVLVR